jgi:hypothetical protein
MKNPNVREKFCEICERITTQRVYMQGRSGSSERPPPRKWWCIDGDHLFGKHPDPIPRLDEPT